MMLADVGNGHTTVTASGNVIEITTDVSKIIAVVYEKLDDDSGRNIAREMFRHVLINLLTDEDSPLFVVRKNETEAGEG